MSRNLITDHFHKKSTDLFHATTRLKDVGVAIHRIDFDAKRINIERPTPEQVFRLGVSAVIAATTGQSEANLKGFKINWEASKEIIEITIPKSKGAMA